MRIMSMIPATLLVAAATLPAQEAWRGPTAEVRPFAGVYIPLGAQQSDFKSATMVGGQAAIEFQPERSRARERGLDARSQQVLYR